LGLVDAGVKTKILARSDSAMELELTKSAYFKSGLAEIPGLLVSEKGAWEFSAPAQEATKNFEIWQWLLALGGALLGGLILNIMPCVFPILALKAFSIAQANKSQSLKRETLLYSAGVIVSFLFLAGLLLVLKALGHGVGWGFQLQSPYVLVALAMLFFVMGLSFLGFLEFGDSFSAWVGRKSSGSAERSAFWTGVLATAVATPCTAPFMGAALGYALVIPAVPALTVFAAMGLGMSVPFLLLGFVPALARLLPRPGPWMEKVKEFMAFPLFATAAWLASIFLESYGAPLWLLLTFTALLFTLWLFRQSFKGAKAWLALALALGALAFCLRETFRAAAGAKSSAQEKVGDLEWQVFSPELVAKLRAEGKVVYLDFTASWCLSCQVNKRVVFGSQEVITFLQEHKDTVSLVRADWTRYDAVITAELAKFGRSGVPLNVVYGPRNSEGLVLPTLLSPTLVLDALKTQL
jgi:thiol:disulfide interchange protein